MQTKASLLSRGFWAIYGDVDSLQLCMH